MSARVPLLDWLREAAQQGGLGNEDLLAVALPLLREVQSIHAEGLVAELRPQRVAYDRAANALTLDRAQSSPPSLARAAVDALQTEESRALEIVGRERYERDVDRGTAERTDLALGEGDGPVTRPVFLPDYHSWEQSLGHHDELTDFFLLGQLLASLATGLDFTVREELAQFVEHRTNLFALEPRLHPVIAGVIGELTELDRHRRARDLGAIILRLENYREQPDDFDVRRIAGFDQATPRSRGPLILGRLRDRLFEISRRNRLLYFKPSQQTINLTVASVPMLLDYRSIRAEQLCYWHPQLAELIAGGTSLPLGRYVRFEDHPYVAPALDKVISAARHDRNEFGFQQLRLVLAFLRWHNLRELPEELIESPLLLLPVELSKRKGVRDSYVLEPSGSVALVNPALRFHLQQLYRLVLPEEIDLRTTTLPQFHEQLRAQIQASEPGVSLKLVDKPQIRLVQERARQRVEAFRRRQAQRGRPVQTVKVSHSYEREDYRPLGLALFRAHVLTRPLPLRLAVGGNTGFGPPPQLTTEAAPGAGVLETERSTFQVGGRREAEANPYAWEFDLGSLTLGNFHTRKMSLVNDYEALLDSAPGCPAFDTIFSLTPREPVREPGPLPLAEQHFVVSCDAAQAAAVAQARSGASFIIQGPPGTGKSQTITNLIADFVARGKRVLFVCEKRAAIDVVFHRLRQQGLDELCCLIHDSQTDKKEFIQNLRATYESFQQPSPALARAAEDRAESVVRLEQDLETLRRFSAHMTALLPQAGCNPRELLGRLLELRPGAGESSLGLELEELLPDYAIWRRHGELARRLEQTLRDCGERETVFARHPLRLLQASVLEAGRPVAELRARLEEAEEALEAVENALGLTAGAEALAEEPMEQLADLLGLAEFVHALAGHGLSGALESKGEGAKTVKQFERELATRTAAHTKAAEKSAGWTDPFPPEETEEAWELAKAREKSILRFVLPAWWRLRGEVNRRYDFSRHKTPPAFARVLGELAATQRAAAALIELREATARDWNCDDPAALVARLRSWQDRLGTGAPVLRAWARRFHEQEGDELAAGVAALVAEVARLRRSLSFLALPRNCTLASLGEMLTGLRRAADLLPELAPALREVHAAEPTFVRALREVPLPAAGLEFAAARKALQAAAREDRQAARFDGAQLGERIERFHALHRGLLQQNAASIRQGVRARFLEHVRLSGLPAAQLDVEEKELKKDFVAGRRELEHEFGKSMRYRSIRDLSAGASGKVLRALKPVWLMSPLSVSDTLPLEAGWFDVVVFDEASQIPLEEAIPAIFRAPQVIVVGDEMQLPPTSFFGAAHEDEEGVLVEEGGERIALALDADSFLTQSAISLPSTLLAWHYRSRSEALISYSNAAFYAAKLLTIPDRTLPPGAREPIVVRGTEEAERGADELLARSISYHRLEEGLYLDRRNLPEAAYIAQLVRALLNRETGQSIGLVAFSEAQQTAVEDAIERLAESDPAFAARYEVETRREEEDQFCGLFIKNLENVQGDERDIIILSICYARGSEGRMLMNFGPINQRGGEKRLNVIFSRAKRHMAVVASIGHGDITNDWNDGANALKNFLRYAAHVSEGQESQAVGVLTGLQAGQRSSALTAGASDVVATQLAAALRERGHVVALSVGQSRFRCDLAVADPRGDAYALAVQVDSAGHYANANLQERYFTRPGLLQAFGWRVLHVLAKDWFEDPARVVERVERALRAEELKAGEDEPAEPDDPEVEDEEGESPPTAPAADLDAPVEPAEAAPEPAVASIFRRYLEFVSSESRKFWEVTVREEKLIVRFGRIGTNGQAQEKQFATPAAARAKAEGLLVEKLAKGYREG